MPFTRTKRKFWFKFTAMFMLFSFLNQIFWPATAWALTSGPTAPEATSFEPIDTTDMVNPVTGDFTYNLPLLEVPGPEGGYPLSLSYHAGIQPDEEASWVGLGWTLNPGAVSRNVNGYPDDFQNVTNTTRSYWNGGTTKTTSVDVGIGLGPASVNFGLAFSQDTYQGFGVGWSIGAGVGLTDKQSPFGVGVGATIGVSPFGEPYAGLNIGVTSGKATDEGMKIGASVGISTNFDKTSVGAGAGVSYSNGKSGMKNWSPSLLGVSMSSSGGGPSLSVGGGSISVNAANVGKIQTQSKGWSFTVPLPGISIGVSHTKVRYWSDETEYVGTNGVLYPLTYLPSISHLDNNAYDVYRAADTKYSNIVDTPDPDKVLGGTFPDYDNYTVTAQGLSGNMRPYAFQQVIYSQNRVNNQDHSNDVTANTYGSNITNKSKLNFRFINDFSNSYRQIANSFSYDFQFDQQPKYGKWEANNTSDGNYGYNPTTNHLEGSKHVDYYTNAQMSGNSNIIETQARGFTRGNDSQIGGFTITNESGVTYHYSLPAYTYDEEVFTEKISRSGGYTWNSFKRPKRYAYTWYLTAVTGPDFVDRGVIGELDDQDWGYWVSYEYGKWANQFDWRNPSEGFHQDIDNEFQSVSSGKKEVYYLDAVRTRSHTALFVKELRVDGKSFGDGSFNYNSTSNRAPIASLRLNNIILFSNEDLATSLNSIRSASSLYNFSSGPSTTRPVRTLDPIGPAGHLGSNVIDIDDLNVLSSSLPVQNILRKIQFQYDYSLCPNTPNSYDDTHSMYLSGSPTAPTTTTKRGKLTLLSVDFQGKGGVSATPPIEFGYDFNSSYEDGNYNYASRSSYSGNKGVYHFSTNIYQIGDIVRFTDGAYAILTGGGNDQTFELTFITGQPSVTTGGYAYRTKNPPYNKDATDMWGCYKADYVPGSSFNIGKATSAASNAATDVWSLRKIRTSLGAEMEISYEGDTYSRSIINHNRSLIITNYQANGTSGCILTVNTQGQDLSKFYRIGDKISFLLLKETSSSNISVSDSYKVLSTDSYTKASTVANVTSNQIYVNFPSQMASDITSKPNQSATTVIKTGNLKVSFQNNRYYGGGIRVKDISTNSLEGYKRRTCYSYGQLYQKEEGQFSSGVTSYEPVTFDSDNIPNISFLDGSAAARDAAKKTYRRELFKEMDELLSLSREIPAPGVMYEFVTMQDEMILPDGKIDKIPGKTVYQFEVFNKGMLGIKDYDYSVGSNMNYNSSTQNIRRNIAIKDYTSRIGNLKRVIQFDNEDNKLVETVNHYLHDDIADKSFDVQVDTYQSRLADYSYQGVIQERYADARKVYTNGSLSYRSVMSARDVYPTIQTGTTVIDYKNRTKVENGNLGYDFYSGDVTKTLSVDSYGNRFITENVPAYKEYPELGLKLNNTANSPRKHMLTQIAATTTYKANSSNQYIGVVSASVQTWGNDVSVLDHNGDATTYKQDAIWRKKANYNWISSYTAANNLTPIQSFTKFNFSGSNNSAWKKTAEITKYNVYSAALEASDINSHFAATRMGYKNSKVIISGGPAKYDEIAYASVEDALLSNGKLSSNISLGTSSVASTVAHTGSKSLSIEPGQNGFNYLVPIAKLDPVPRDYIAMVWVKSNGSDVTNARMYYQVDGQAEVQNSPAFQKVAAGWYLMDIKIPSSALTSGNLTVGCKNIGGTATLYFDDFRFQPLTAVTNANVYDPHSGELSYILDNNNLYTRFVYDEIGRLTKTYREVLGKSSVPLVNETAYHYARSGGGPNAVTYTPNIAMQRTSVGSSPGPINFNVSNGPGSTSFPAGTTFAWNFGDGTTSSNQNGTHVYAVGVYNATLTVSHPQYGTYNFSQKVKVVRLTITHSSSDPYYVMDVEGLNLSNCIVGVWDAYCENFDGETCDPDLIPRTYYSLDVNYPLEWWSSVGCSSSNYYASNRFRYEIIDSDGDTFSSEEIINSPQPCQ